MSRQIFPVYTFANYRREVVFNAFDTFTATDFALAGRADGLSLYLAPSRTIQPKRTWTFIYLEDENGVGRNFVIRGDLPGANMGRHLCNFMRANNLRIVEIYQYDARSLREARRWLAELNLL